MINLIKFIEFTIQTNCLRLVRNISKPLKSGLIFQFQKYQNYKVYFINIYYYTLLIYTIILLQYILL